MARPTTRAGRVAAFAERWFNDTFGSNGIHGFGKVWEREVPRPYSDLGGKWMSIEVTFTEPAPLEEVSTLLALWKWPYYMSGNTTISVRLANDNGSGGYDDIGWKSASATADGEATVYQAEGRILEWKSRYRIQRKTPYAFQVALQGNVRFEPRSMFKGRGTSKPKHGRRSSRAPSGNRGKKRKPSRGARKRRS